MSLIRLLKSNLRLRSLTSVYYRYFGFSRKSFGHVGKEVTITPPLCLSNPRNIYLYDHTKIEHATIAATNAKFIMKKWSGSAYGLNVHTGNHAMIIGRFYRSVTEAEKPADLDRDVVVEEDVWIGSNVTLLAGVNIGRGSVVAAGAVVNKSLPPYCIAGGVPARFIKFKWTIDQILKHEEMLYPEDERFSREQLEEIFKQYNKK